MNTVEKVREAFRAFGDTYRFDKDTFRDRWCSDVENGLVELEAQIAELAERLARTERERDGAELMLRDSRERVKAAERERDERFSGQVQANRRARLAETQRDELMEALEWYANVLHKNGSSGDRARDALAKVKP